MHFLNHLMVMKSLKDCTEESELYEHNIKISVLKSEAMVNVGFRNAPLVDIDFSDAVRFKYIESCTL